MDFRQLRYALAVARERSFTKAAKRVNISQSAVSEQVKLLEEEIGFELFRRTSGGVETTDRGRTFLYEAERVMGDLLSLSDTARRLRGALSDTLILGIGSGMAQIFMPPLFADLVVLEARDAREAFATRLPRRFVIRRGRLIAETTLQTRRSYDSTGPSAG